ncbi:MAG: FAD-dependent oxidoreductase [Bacillota bacterium]|nr:FAD-dependent oxidoreductase [Bacillota bacterium]
MYDILIIGGGPAGLSAAIYSGRGGMKTAVIESSMTGGQASRAPRIENYPGFPQGIGGVELGMAMLEQAQKSGAEVIYEKAAGFEADGSVKKVQTNAGLREAHALILCLGTKPRQLGLDDEIKLTGAGVSYCAMCDGAFFRGKDVAVVGGGDTALDDAAYLSKIASRVYLIHRRGELRGAKAAENAVRRLPNCELILGSVVEKLKGSEALESIDVKNLKTGEIKNIPVSGLFIAVGQTPDTGWLRGKLGLTPEGFIIVDENMKTSLEGVFAAGDVRIKPLRQISTAVSDGAVAAISAIKYIRERQ